MGIAVVVALLALSVGAHAEPRPLEPPRTWIRSASAPPAEDGGEGFLIVANWTDSSGEQRTYDHSKPPIRWPRPAYRVTSDSPDIQLVFGYAQPPSEVAVRIFTRIRRNGVPRGPATEVLCTWPEASSDGCAISPASSSDGAAWAAALSLPSGAGHYYVAAQAYWPQPTTTNNGAWGFHARVSG